MKKKNKREQKTETTTAHIGITAIYTNQQIGINSKADILRHFDVVSSFEQPTM